MRSADEIRQQFIDFFVKKHGHTAVPSSPVVPHDDPTLLFTNAGMNQFKDVFLGTGTRPYKRATNTQKCIRAGGKHNDLDDVGKDTYHHTFFEMLGNWSFGDYFKKEAIRWAWELLTEEWGLDKSRLHATVFEGDQELGLAPDDEAAALWRSETDIDPSHIHKGNKKDNFWEMGETGPCGPCTEIHIDRTPDKSGGKLVNAGTPDVIEIWNLVFIQFNRGVDKKLTPLPARHVDTGMGFERVTAVLQGKNSNYDTDVFTPIFAAIQKVTGAEPYTGKLDDFKDTAYRVIADHIRALTFSLTDGAVPSNEGRGYVVRSILRRAERYGRMYLNTAVPFLYELVPVVRKTMCGVFPELVEHAEKVDGVVLQEETSFIRTFDRGIRLFHQVAERSKIQTEGTIPGQDVFDLHTTYGFFPEITLQMAAERGLTVDEEGYRQRMKEFQQKSGKDRKKVIVSAISGELPKTNDSPKYDGLSAKAKVVGWVKDNAVVKYGRLTDGDEAALLLDHTNFYAEQGGQVGDTGAITTDTGRFNVEDTQRLGNAVLHVGRVVDGHIETDQSAVLNVGSARVDTMRNHTATHLMNWALRKVLGGAIDQKGSLVDPWKTRFDFTHDKPLSAQEVSEIERLVNWKIYSDLPVSPVVMPLAEAKKIPGVRAVFGEKYPDPVRVLLIGADRPEDATEETSVEFCGGSHLLHTGQAGFFKIVSQEGVAKGVRRVTAVTGHEAVEMVQQQSALLDELSARLNCKPDEIPNRIQALQDEVKKLQAQVKKGAAGDLAGAADKLLAAAVEANGAKIIVGEMPSGPAEQMGQQVDRLRQIAGSAVVVIGWSEDGKVGLIAAATEDLVKKGADAGKLVGEAAKVVGGKGGGRKDMARAGGKDASKLGEALQAARKLAAEQLGGMRSPLFCYDSGMSNQILHVRVDDHSLDPAQAELRISVAAEHIAPTTELRGRLMGPRCAYAATVEVAYPLRPLARPDGLSGRVVIPEPSLWEPSCPFLYGGAVELWEGGVRCDQAPIRRGLRRVLLGRPGLRVNGEPLVLRGRTVTECNEAAAESLRRGGVNLLLTAAAGSSDALWDVADRQGFFVLGRLNDLRDASLQLAVALSDHPSCLGWLLPPGAHDAAAVLRRLNRQALVGVELGEAPRDPLPTGVNFIACPSGLADGLRPLGLPFLLLDAGPASPDVFGTVE